MRARTGAFIGLLLGAGGCFDQSGDELVHAPDPGSGSPSGFAPFPPMTAVAPISSVSGFAGGVAPLPTDVGPVVRSEVPPAPIQGGTLLVASDGTTAIAADSDRDRVVFADLVNAGVLGQVDLPAGSEPGRLVEDASGRVHVVLRRTGEIAVVDVATRALLRQDAVCAVPQGLAYDAGLDAIHVACTGGELVTLAVADGSTLRSLRLDPDLRDVVVRGETLFVSRFKTAELLTLDAAGEVVERRSPSNLVGPFESPLTMPSPDAGEKTFSPAVAWRLVERPNGMLTMLHQRGQLEPIDLGDCTDMDCTVPPKEPDPGAGGAAGGVAGAPAMDPFSSDASYGGGFDCNGIVQTSITHFDEGVEINPPLLGTVTLAVDAAISPDGAYMALAVAGNSPSSMSAEMFFPQSDIGAIVMPTDPAANPQECIVPGLDGSSVSVLSSGQSIAVAFDGEGRLVVQARDPNRLRIYDPSTFSQCFGCGSSIDISLGGAPRRDTGHDLFHTNAGAGLACASCHPGGIDDGRTWSFVGLGPRRTQLFNMGIRDTEPLHWDGSLPTFGDLVGEVFVKRMGGAPQSEERIAALGDWIESLSPHPPVRAANDASAVRGRALFESEQVGCVSCHDGAKLTNNTTQDVGTGGSFQVPSLVGVYYHEPYLHTGCAGTLRDRFDPACGGGDTHGKTSQLAASEIDDLVAYLESL